MKLTDFKYELQSELIAQTPLTPRDSSRLLIYNRETKETKHKHFYDILDYMNSGDCLFINETKVIPARLIGQKPDGREIEFLLLVRIDLTTWEIICKPAKKLKIGDVVVFAPSLRAKILEKLDGGITIVEFEFNGVFESILDELGTMPLPPYITEKLSDKERYQTVYAKETGSSAAPTAGLHFTNELLEKIANKGIEIIKGTLHVGLGTFRPVKCDNIIEHNMHSEYFELSENSALSLNNIRKSGGKIFACGTTGVRILESCCDEQGIFFAKRGNTKIFIYPPYEFYGVDALITNFHLSESTLLMLVCAFSTREEILKIYQNAVDNRYRFFSFGDAMLIL